MAVTARTDPTAFGNPEAVLERSYYFRPGVRTYDVSADGQRFLMIKDRGADETTQTELILVQNWTEELKRLVPVDN